MCDSPNNPMSMLSLGYNFITLFLHIVDGLLKNNMSHKHIDKCFKTMKMRHDGSISNSKIQNFQTNI